MFVTYQVPFVNIESANLSQRLLNTLLLSQTRHYILIWRTRQLHTSSTSLKGVPNPVVIFSARSVLIEIPSALTSGWEPLRSASSTEIEPYGRYCPIIFRYLQLDLGVPSRELSLVGVLPGVSLQTLTQLSLKYLIKD
jgi:hypothetical protein